MTSKAYYCVEGILED